ncbi:MAG TPA: hypothetical protein VFF48_01745 [Brevundimonas sp.]|nr:hypothetical protein [Brevundimonas sp.]
MTQSTQALAAAAEAETRPRIDPADVVGWAVDADAENDPTWPMRDRSRDDGPGMNWTPPETQHTGVEILQSVEHLRRPAVVGQSTPPSGVSGVIRRAAFTFSESQWGHWLLLMLADRINTVEGVLDDLLRGRAPNPLVEMGIVERSRSRESAIATAAVLGLVAVGVVTVVRRRR